jgi:dihydroflavonol-4-reductase
MRALVTGATGLVGANLVRELLAAGHAVRALVRTTSDRRNLAGLDLEIVTGDVLAPATLPAAVADCDVVFHAAAVFAYWGAGARQLNDVACAGTRHVLEAAAAAKVGRVVLTSSSVVLGAADTPGVRDESAVAPAVEDNPYAAAKRRQETEAFAAARALSLPLVAVLPTVCLGPHDHGPSESNAIVVNYLRDPYRTTWPGGANVVAAADVARGHLLAAERGTPGERYLLGGENLAWADLHRLVSELCGIPGPLVTANHTASFLTGAVSELVSLFSGRRPPTTRTQARMVGRYYWYDHSRAHRLGYRPRPARRTVAEALAWLVHSEHVSASVYQQLRLAPEVLAAREAGR